MATLLGRVGPSGGSSKRPEVLKSTYNGGFEWSWTFELDNLDLTHSKLDTKVPIRTPMAGEWSVTFFTDFDNAAAGCSIGVECRRPSAHRSVTADVRLFWTEQNRCALVAAQSWSDVLASRVGKVANIFVVVGKEQLERAEKESQGHFVAAKHSRYLLYVGLEERSTVPLASAIIHKSRAPDTSRSPMPHNVRLFFPNAGEEGAEIWTTSHLLASSSPYLRDLLSSDFAESITLSSSKRQRRTAAPEQVVQPPMQPSKDYHDSDDELDDLFLYNFPRSLFNLELVPEHSFRQITITSTAYTTYFAAIRWLETGSIAFGDLTSECRPLDPSAAYTRDEYLRGELLGDDASQINQDCKKDPQYPPWCPVSPKSVYRLAHLLQLDHLQQVCLTYIGQNITHPAAARELFDDVSILYDDWRKVLIDFVVENWDEVTTTSTWQELDARIERDELPGAAPILRQLMTGIKVKADKDRKQALVTASNAW